MSEIDDRRLQASNERSGADRKGTIPVGSMLQGCGAGVPNVGDMDLSCLFHGVACTPGGNSAYEMPGPALFDGASSGSGSGSSNSSAAAPAASTPAATSAAAATSSAAIQNNAVSTPVATSTPAASSASAPASTGSADIADKEFTLDTFIAWLEEKAGSSSSQKVRRHPRAFRV